MAWEVWKDGRMVKSFDYGCAGLDAAYAFARKLNGNRGVPYPSEPGRMAHVQPRVK